MGDVYRIGEVTVQVSQPRKPCWQLSRRRRIADLAQQVLTNGRSGWYFRVLQEGQVAPGQELRLCDGQRPAQWAIAPSPSGLSPAPTRSCTMTSTTKRRRLS